MPYIEAEMSLRCSNETLLLERALAKAVQAGLSRSDYLARRDAAPDGLMHDLETVVRATLLEAGTSLISWNSRYGKAGAPGGLVILDDLHGAKKNA